MSNFNCEKCGAECIDSEHGYVTGCEHYPVDVMERKIMKHQVTVKEIKDDCFDVFSLKNKYNGFQVLINELREYIAVRKYLHEIPLKEQEYPAKDSAFELYHTDREFRGLVEAEVHGIFTIIKKHVKV